jgi:hypothetical protein
MQFWDSLINTAMVGTDKKQVGALDLPPGLEEVSVIIHENPEKDKEEKFLQLASVAFNYRQCGLTPAANEIKVSFAPDEEKSYCNKPAIQVLKDISGEESIPLLRFWLQHCDEKQKLVTPGTVPHLLSTVVQHKKLQYLVASCCGKRGEWLAAFNPEWNFFSTQTGEELWQTGTLEQRKEVLKQTRKTDPAKAREWVEQTWAQEDANTKLSLLEIFHDNPSDQDISFLESLSAEKGKKVKEEALKLLRNIPGSSIVREYEELIRQSVSIKKEKTLLGMSSKTVLGFRLPASIPDTIFKSGIQKLSGEKNITDESFILYQLIGSIPPSFWENHLSCSPADVVELFRRTDEGKKMFPALGLATGRFRTKHWATLFTDEEKSFYPEIIPLLEKKEREQYLLKFINVDTMRENVIQYASQEENEWGIDLARAILRHAAKNPYQFNRSFFNRHIHLLPVQIIGELEKYTPSEEHLRNSWSNMSEYITKLVTLKIQTIKAFNE